jgi:signal peptide peptidase SppA
VIRSAFDLAAAEAWALDPGRLELVQRIADRDIDSADMAALRVRLGLPAEWNPGALATREGRGVDTAHPGVQMRGDVAVIPLVGMMFRYANLFTDFSGGTATGLFAQAVQQAADDSAVRAIVLSIDSPGGEANGVNETAKLVQSIRGQKPIKAYVGGLSASGAYWIAAAADEIVVDDAAMLGSIGVVSQIRKRADLAGVKTIDIVSSQSPLKRPNVETEEGRAVIQSRVDAMAQVFINAVAKNRGVSSEHVIAEFGRGHVLVGEQAISVRAADRIGTLEGLIAELNAKHHSGRTAAGPTSRGETMSSQTQSPETIPVASITAPYVAEHFPQVAEALRAEGRAKGVEDGRQEGAKAERERISGLEEVAVPGHEKLLADAKADGRTTGPQLAVAIIKAEKAKGTGYLEALAADSQSVPQVELSSGGGSGKSSTSSSTEDRAKADWDKDGGLRAEFGDDFAAFLTYRKREAAGLEKKRG